MRYSKQRELVLDELQARKDHPTADELYHDLRSREPRISMGTVYRNLERLRQKGLLRIIETGGQKRFDADISPHAHFRCRECGKVTDIPLDTSLIAAGAPELTAKGYRTDDTVVEFQGLCPDCRPGAGE